MADCLCNFITQSPNALAVIINSLKSRELERIMCLYIRHLEKKDPRRLNEIMSKIENITPERKRAYNWNAEDEEAHASFLTCLEASPIFSSELEERGLTSLIKEYL